MPTEPSGQPLEMMFTSPVPSAGPAPQPAPATGSLRFQTHFSTPELSRLDIPVEVRRKDLSVVACAMSSQTVPGLEPGEYLVMARLPAGQLLTASVHVTPGALQTVDLTPDSDGGSTQDANEVPRFIGPPRRSALPPQARIQRGQWSPPVPTAVEATVAAAALDPSLPAPASSATEAPFLESLGGAAGFSPALSFGLSNFGVEETPGVAGAEPDDPAIDLILAEYARLQSEGPGDGRPEEAPAAREAASALPATPEAPPLSEIRLRLFRGNVLAGRALPVPADQLAQPLRDERGIRLQIPGVDEVSYLQVLLPGQPALNLTLPACSGEFCEVVLIPLSAAAAGDMESLVVEVYLGNVDANALLRYRAQGLTSDAAATTASEDQAVSAKRLLHGKAREPVAAAIGAYALLRFNRLDRLQDWAENLYDGSRTLPDGAAILGEHLARQGEHAEALKIFLSLAERGLPLFTEGISYSLERLDLYIRLYSEGRKGPLDAGRHESARLLLELLQRFSTCTDHRRFVVRFTGLSPNAPGNEVWSPALLPAGDPALVTIRLGEDSQSASVPPQEGESMPLSAEMLAQTEQRYQAHEAERASNVRKIEAAKKGEARLMDVDDPRRVALRTQRILSQPAVVEALGTAQGGALESLGTVETQFLERIIGGSNLLGIAFLEVGSTVSHTVGRIHINSQFQTLGFGTGFLVSPRLLLTNNHVLPSRESALFSVVEFHFQNGVDGRPLTTHTFELQPGVFFATHPTLDFTLVAVAEHSRAQGSTGPVPLARFGFNRLSRDQGKILIGECINVIQHPDGKPKQIALQQNELIDRVDDFLHYRTDTAPGSSGSPLYNNQWEVVGLHHSGVPERRDGQIISVDGTPWTPDMGEAKVRWIANEGARISSVMAQAASFPGLSPAQLQLLEEMLNPPTGVSVPATPPVAPPAPPVQPLVTPIPSSPGSPESGLTAAVANASGTNGTVTLTIPIQITIQLGSLQDGASSGIATVAALPAGLVEEAVSIDPDYSTRAGYDPAFLPNATPVALPVLTSAQRANTALNQRAAPGQDATLLSYHHFSVVMNKARRLAWYTVVNIDGNIHRNLEREQDRWILDPRLRKEEQIGGALYAGNDFDQGHLVRRLDPAWGSDEATARVANDDTFHYTNCSPQHKNFNRNASLWAGLENFILDNARAQRLRVTVFNGPVLADDDPLFQGVKIPLAFWKIMAFQKPDGRLSSTAYLISQKRLVEAMLQEAFTPQTFQVPVRKITELTGLDFSPLFTFDPMNGAFQESVLLREAAGIPAAGREIENYGNLAL